RRSTSPTPARPTRPSTGSARPCWTSRARRTRSPCPGSRTRCASATPSGPRRTSATPASSSSSRRPRPRGSSTWNGTVQREKRSSTCPAEPVPVEIREARTADEVAAAGRVTVVANAEFAPAAPDDPFTSSWARYLAEMADAAARAAQGVLLVAVEEGRVVGTVTLYLAPGSMQWRPEDAMFRLLAVDPPARGRGVGHALFQGPRNRGRAAGKGR